MNRTGIVWSVAALGLLVAAPLAAQFEAPKRVVEDFDGPKITFGADFTQTFQVLDHSNAAQPVIGPTGLNTTELGDIGAGFNLAAANLSVNLQMAPGVQVVLENYLSSRHHNEFWAKGGYIQIDQSPIGVEPLQVLMAFTTIKVGHYEVNYGDAHFRRTDNGNAIANPFVENYILDAFTTEIGGEVIGRVGPFLGVLGVTNGQNKGDVTRPADRSWAFITKAGVDHRFSEGLRGRLTVSTYQNDNAGRATLYGGDRAGSAYWGVMDNSAQSAFTNGRLNPNFSEEIRALQVNPYVELGDLELFGVVERATGRTAAQTDMRDATQLAGDVVYRLLDDRLYVGGRYNTVTAELFAPGSEQTSERVALAGGWFVTPGVLLKAELVRQTYDGFAATHILHDGEFDGLVLQGVVSF